MSLFKKKKERETAAQLICNNIYSELKSESVLTSKSVGKLDSV